LNRAVAVAMAHGPQAGLVIVDAIESSGRLEGYHLLAATKADFYRRLGRRGEAAAAYEEALGLATSESEQRYLRKRLDEVRSRTARAT
jgi:RNA polymerase sigma-70 factor, ECF subfamily